MKLPQPSRAGSTAAGVQAAFRPHGKTQMWSDGAMVHVIAEGPFNREGIDAFSNEMVRLYRQLPVGMRFVNVTEVRHTLLGTPDAWELLGEHLLRINRSGLPLVATAWVVADDVEGRSLLLPRAEALFAAAARSFEVFATLPAAETWARSRLSS